MDLTPGNRRKKSIHFPFRFYLNYVVFEAFKANPEIRMP